ncbi:hypothetical protein [Actinomadura sp. 7K507]|uniref:hypothetical protein n=1 Tax=Actinomadura sp. 7K507 TaxID=2530365 RepID=UPI001049BEEF|nr:hypothetical protein [Actinomadura sp. 7K507]TDC88839.1 hypothetical protein E1285_17615 [Actinomadura sp. 7K507]
MSPDDGDDGGGDSDDRRAAVERRGRRDLSEYPSRWPVSGWAKLGTVAFVLALFVLPAVMTYTHLFGREVSVRIDRCDLPSRTGDGCRGSWTDSRGERNTTTLWHVGEEDQGRTVKARLGPMGAHTGGLSGDWLVFLMLLPLLGIP